MAAATYDGPPQNTARIFVDGVLESARKLPAALDTGSLRTWRIGRHLVYSTPFRGAIDDVRVHGRALAPPWIMALYRCSSQQTDLLLPGGLRFYYLPVFPSSDIQIGSAGQVVNTGGGYGGIQLGRSDGNCAIDSIRGADIGQDLQISVDLLAPPQAHGEVMGGPYFRSRAAAPGDGTIGGTSAGYWVQLDSTGRVRVRCLNPQRVVAYAAPAPDFDATRFHRLEIVACGTELQAALDGNALEFDQGGQRVRSVSIPPSWEGQPPIGFNQGTAGIAFASDPSGGGTGQQARDIHITVLGK